MKTRHTDYRLLLTLSVVCWPVVVFAAETKSPTVVHVAPMSVQLDEKGKVMLDLVPIPAGNFTMGIPPGESPAEKIVVNGVERIERRPEETDAILTKVRITRPFWLGRTVITQGQWKALYSGGTLRNFAQGFVRNNQVIPVGPEGDDYPMIYVSWEDAEKFCQELTSRAETTNMLPSGYEYRLPTEAEWEYACRAGTTTATYAGPMPIKFLGDRDTPIFNTIAWSVANSSEAYAGDGWKVLFNFSKEQQASRRIVPLSGPHKVAMKRPNAWGLYDMLGNVTQWCEDAYVPLPGGRVILVDPIRPYRPGTDAVPVRRGGSWLSFPYYCRAGMRTQLEVGNLRGLGDPDEIAMSDGTKAGWATDKPVVLTQPRRDKITGEDRIATMGFRVALAPILNKKAAAAN